MRELMVRKQIYLPRRQNLLLKRLAKQRGVSEAEVVRQALERDAEAATYPPRERTAEWDAILRFVKERKAVYTGQGKPVQWNRQDLYDEPEKGK
jgi:hypothetical protein